MILRHILIVFLLSSAIDAIRKTNKFKKKEYLREKEDKENNKRKKIIEVGTVTSKIFIFSIKFE